ncbi:MAG: galactose-1-phosphate uridylyltransferase [Planctomycetota bacterium]
MTELRRDPLTGRRVYIAEDRAGRPNDFVLPGADELQDDGAADCPFCPGHEADTPPALLELTGGAKSTNDGGWLVRVIPNKYPAVSAAAEAMASAEGLFLPAEPAAGGHEVIIESPEHVSAAGSLSAEQLTLVLQAYAHRLRYWAGVPGVRYAFVFKNEGYAAGASLHHVHSQLVALPAVPPEVERSLAVAGDYYQRRGESLLLSLLESELSLGVRVVAETDALVVLSAQAARQPYEMLIVPRRRAARFEAEDGGLYGMLAEMLLPLLGALGRLLSPLSYNLILRTCPAGSEFEPFYQWHVELVPRSCRLAGFEWGSGLLINPLSPERAADRLRDALSSGPLG